MFEKMQSEAKLPRGRKAMLKRLGDAGRPLHRTRSRYSPPSKIQKLSVLSLIEGSPRSVMEKGQLDLIKSIMPQESRADLCVFAAGDTSLLKRRCISVIGTRNVSEDGARRAHRLAKELVERGIVVVSGLADGVDTVALRSAMENQGKVVAVIGTPLDQAYPAKNAELQEEIYRDHLLISQFPEGSRVFPSNFPSRNRTMALLSDASIVIEASDTSGTLHQAAECVRLNRWLCIANSVVEDPNLKWPKKFLTYPKCFILKSTDELITAVYGS